jgi:hypothetical protein
MLKRFAQNSKKPLLILAGFFLLAIAINLVILEVFHQKSAYRAAHSLVGIIVLMGFVYTLSGDHPYNGKTITLFLISLVPCYLGTLFSDLDITLLGIGGHRNPIFHSGLLFFLLLLLTKRFDSYLFAVSISAFGVGLGSHLIWDLFGKGDVRWISGGTLDALWLGVNGSLCILLARRSLLRRITMT